ncbi:DTW domain-containing protein [Myxococcus sp. MISCRS1]|uniref:tRNA-uridine aminocarboxypropyltransferase n=1 Tax=Myxococcus TaxID=32 RepID=UPI0011418DCD|nr:MULTISPECIES: tRNA-uridine aminocarboxypropyltransferase [Myxococcus]BDT33229.1 DTW domain-containing protein [Myxococcus sp. MH1]MBZ4397143.1 DTW domain-containing protein [Myxococcus sp. AS-1-15]MBZ4408133.1 DTW domain-containing protein [Myxococcus sp. XM-1-1-1]MCK8503415.1 DTW domain-containing protein [Myxococcus fulvus]MCY0996759.1 DTW domain-containing protein [Myxococcus sp. MISCRS1]
MSSRVALRPRCDRCYLPSHLCLCAEIPRVQTRTRFLLVQHALEIRKKSNTGRVAALALTNATLLTHGSPADVLDSSLFAEPGTWLLFPDGPELPEDTPPPRQVVVLDGSWSQARRMSQRLPTLRLLPRLVLPPPPPGMLHLREPSHPAGMSTLDAIARAVELLEGPQTAAPLARLAQLRVQRIAECGSLNREAMGPSR